MKHYQSTLEAELKTLTQELTAIGIHNPENAADWVAVPEGAATQESDMDLIADTVEEWDGRQALVATLERRYNDIIRALHKIQSGTYGTCEVCGAHIEEARLTVNPAARTCTTHMNDEEALPA